jgi:hypothetical protein
MAKDVELQIRQIFSRAQRAVVDAVSAKATKAVGEKAVEIVRRRTRLGYGATENFGQRSRLKPLSSKYVAFRSTFSELYSQTTPKRSNLTLTGQMLDSLRVISSVRGAVVIGPKGARDDEKTNEEIAGYVSEQGRPFLFVTTLEFNQLFRFYRQTFTDLLKRARVGYRRK